MHDELDASGVFSICCTGSDGQKKWEIESSNLITTGGGNLLLDAGFSNADPGDTSFVGLITASDFGVISRSDTMTVRQWIESNCAGVQRPTISWQSATTASKRFSTPVIFNVTAPDTVSGIFIVYGPSSSATVFNEQGVLWSATDFVNSSQAVLPGDSISIQYLVSLFKTGAAPPSSTVVSEASTAFSIHDAFINSTASFEEITSTDSSEVVMNWARTGIDSLAADEVSFAFVTLIVPDEFESFGLDILVAQDVSSVHVVQDVVVTNDDSIFADEIAESVVVISSPDTFSTLRRDLQIAQDQYFVHLIQTVEAATSDSLFADEIAFALVGTDDFTTFVFDLSQARDQSFVHIVDFQTAARTDSLAADEVSDATVIESAPDTFEPVRFDVLISTATASVHIVDSITTTYNESLAAGTVSFAFVITTTPGTFDMFRLDLSLAQDTVVSQVIRHLTRSDQLTASSAAVASLTTANQQRTDLLIGNTSQSALITRVASRSDSLLASFIEHSDAVLADFRTASDTLNAVITQTVRFNRAGIGLEIQGHDLTDSSAATFKQAAALTEAATGADTTDAIVSSPGNWFEAMTEAASAADAPNAVVTRIAAIVETGSPGTLQFIDPWFLVDQAGNFVVDVDGNLVIAPGTGP